MKLTRKQSTISPSQITAQILEDAIARAGIAATAKPLQRRRSRQQKILWIFCPRRALRAIAIWSSWRKQKLPLYLFLGMCFNLVVAPMVYAATGEQFSHTQAWALGLLGLATVSLSIYLFSVMFIPEKF